MPCGLVCVMPEKMSINKHSCACRARRHRAITPNAPLAPQKLDVGGRYRLDGLQCASSRNFRFGSEDAATHTGTANSRGAVSVTPGTPHPRSNSNNKQRSTPAIGECSPRARPAVVAHIEIRFRKDRPPVTIVDAGGYCRTECPHKFPADKPWLTLPIPSRCSDRPASG